MHSSQPSWLNFSNLNETGCDNASRIEGWPGVTNASVPSIAQVSVAKNER